MQLDGESISWKILYMEVAEQLQKLRAQLAFAPNSRRALEAFTHDEQHTLLVSRRKKATVDDLIAAYARKCGFDQDRALLELALRSWLIDPGSYQLLLHAIGENRVTSADSTPCFQSDGTLLLHGRRIGRFQLRSSKTRFQLILDAFQKSGWPAKVKVPWNAKTAQDLHDAVNKLNQLVNGVRFHVHGGCAVSWELVREKNEKIARKQP